MCTFKFDSNGAIRDNLSGPTLSNCQPLIEHWFIYFTIHLQLLQMKAGRLSNDFE